MSSASPARPPSRLYTAAVLLSALAAVGCGVGLLAQRHHRPRPLPATWFAPVDFAAVHGLGGRP